MLRWIFVFTALALSSAFASPQAAAPIQTKSILLKAGRILDVRTGKYIPSAGVLIEQDKIKEAGPLAQVRT